MNYVEYFMGYAGPRLRASQSVCIGHDTAAVLLHNNTTYIFVLLFKYTICSMHDMCSCSWRHLLYIPCKFTKFRDTLLVVFMWAYVPTNSQHPFGLWSTTTQHWPLIHDHTTLACDPRPASRVVACTRVSHYVPLLLRVTCSLSFPGFTYGQNAIK